MAFVEQSNTFRIFEAGTPTPICFFLLLVVS